MKCAARPFLVQVSAMLRCAVRNRIGLAPGPRYQDVMIFRRLIVALSTAFLAMLSAASAQTRVENDYTATEIAPEAAGFVPGGTLWFAIRQEIRPGWHVFWTNPGDAGLPLRLDWSLPQGFEAGEILHPAPEFIPVGPLASYAHEGAPVFLVPVTVPEDANPGETVDIDIHASWQACEEICVPEKGRFSFSVPVLETGAMEPARRVLFSLARAKLPKAYEERGRIAVEDGAYVLTVAAPQGFTEKNAFFFARPEGVVSPPAPQEMEVEDGVLRIAMQPGWVERYDEETFSGVLTFSEDAGRRALAVTADVAEPLIKPGAPPEAPPQKEPSLPLLFLFAFLGGVILNVMPCVFPVVFIKAASFMQSAREHPGAVRLHGLLYMAGVLSTFLLMGGALLALRAGGAEFGWGFHLQSPWVVALSAYVLLLVGLNLAGLYSVGGGIAGAGQKLAAKPGGLGAFFTGALAVLVAAPCIGPLLSAPMGAALLLPPVAGLLIFALLGLGLAAPYVILSFVPGLGARLPRPGPWMIIFKQALSFPVFAAAAYFLWVLAQQATGAGLAAVLAGGVLLAFSAWVFDHSRGANLRALILRVLSALAAVMALAPLLRLEPAVQATAGQADLGSYGALRAETYDADALQAYRNQGTPVFIDFTAAWCVTCQFNKMTVFSDRAVARAFDESGTVFMVADWTVRDPEITEALAGFGASGVPLYVYYGPSGEASVLPLPLTKKSVLRAVSGAGL
ncbi:MAG: thiol:disulfide interchange protein [Parvularcula sp.]|nr:thiol:disulfide interchange protein [Parvularcula sp.]